ncbi:sensor histidine kinase YesM [Paenibacillus rhizosphaerae]|uniref:histidine kinase n=1 Tax=Paenibacillus rhizosphaerae TaxID=297318 RepID=A0A839TVX4_9BACL|nr:sensor histidine kinase [Paenibacillus rhizosphaerae]MBB3128837.1 sensor histidine kinase YesM [Paenibacillus rhizosphaerae]
MIGKALGIVQKSGFISFGFKLMISYLVLVLTPVSLVGFIAYHSSLKSIQTQAESNLTAALVQMKENVQYKTSGIQRISDQIFYDLNIQKLLRTSQAGWTSYEKLQNYALPMLQNIMLQTSAKMQMRIYFVETGIPEIYGESSSDLDPLSDTNRFDLLHYDRIGSENWLRSLPWSLDSPIPVGVYKGQEVLWRQVDNDKKFGNISMIRRLVDFDDRKTIGLIRIIVKEKEIFESVSDKDLSEGSIVFVKDGSGAVIYPQLPQDSSTNGEKDMLRISQNAEVTGWQLNALIPKKVLEKDAIRVRNITLLVCVASTVLLLLIGALLSRYFSERVRRILLSFDAFRAGEFDNRMDFSGKDEFAQIARAFNKMGREINELIQENYVVNYQKKEAELETLQAQINPHFLYNTLSSISRLAKMGELDKLQSMVAGLARFYRLTLNEGKTHIPVEKELEQAKTYMEIQQIKHRDRIQVWYDIHPEVYGYETIKLILQPFLENALQHAFYADTMTIKLTARREKDRLIFCIIDDGIGMSREQLHRIRNTEAVRVGYGIRNVDERIKLQYGQQFGVVFGSALGMGTSVRIEIPAVLGNIPKEIAFRTKQANRTSESG